MMQSYSKNEAIDRINKLAKTGKAFLFIINYKQDCSFVEQIDNIDPSELLYNLNGFSNCTSVPIPLQSPITWRPTPISLVQYKTSFDIVRRNILGGNSFLTNLTCITPVATNLRLEDIFYHSQALYKLWLKNRFVVFSPEIFIRIENGKICSYPMKGTMDATLPSALEVLMEDEKEAAEHATIVDLIRNDLSMVADCVAVTRYRYVDTLHTNHGPILQTSSEISGILPKDYVSCLGDILFKLLPAGSITGAPKHKTMEIIEQAENYDRGFYTGITGYYNGKKLDSAVMIRFIEEQDGKMFFKSGGGITCKSDLESEYNEMKQKVYVPIY